MPWLNLAQRDRNGQRRRMILWPVKIPSLSKTSFCSRCGVYFARAGSVARAVTTGQYRLLNVMTVFLRPWTGRVAAGHPDSPSSSLSINSEAVPMYLTASSLSNANSPVSPSRTSPHHLCCQKMLRRVQKVVLGCHAPHLFETRHIWDIAWG